MKVWSLSSCPVTRHKRGTLLSMSYMVCSFTPPQPFWGVHHGCLRISSETVVESIAKKPFSEKRYINSVSSLPCMGRETASAIILRARPRYMATSRLALAWDRLLRLTLRPMPMA